MNKERKNVGAVLNSLATQFIVPKAVFEKAAQETGNKIAGWETTEAMGTGPFTLELADQTQIILARHEEYWGKDFYGGLPAMTKIIHPIFKSNEDGNLKFQNGELDVMRAVRPPDLEDVGEREAGGHLPAREAVLLPGLDADAC
ncbi:ABC transporter substrate-binding protein [Brachybacterium sp. GPGPB12]|uniref:ABC transporter substrate-binding protein n=1 Tax=Brachybacterium sp. GPGPB12 TaxID=3023517 RepID=UPI003134324B